MQGPYNAASPAYVTQLDVVRGLAKAMNKKGIRFPVPSLMLRVVLGEMANMILFGSRVSSEKLIKAGYQFEFDNLQKALNDIIG